MKINEMTEAFAVGPFPEPDSLEYLKKVTLDGATKIKDITAKLSLYQNGPWYSLVNSDGLTGGVKLLPKTILGTIYTHVEVIYVLPQYRKTNVAKWLIYAIKEVAEHRVIADGAIFSGGEELLQHHMMQAKVLNKKTGDIEPLTKIKYDPDKCYVFEQTTVGFGKQIFPEGVGFTWYQLFD
jgi:GNAT superfamily N-acetyltransferase